MSSTETKSTETNSLDTNRMDTSLIKLNLGSGVGLLPGFVNVDAFFTLEQLLEGERTKEGFCQNAVVPADAQYVQADILKLEEAFPADYADYVLMNNVLEHFPIHATQFVCDQVYRVLKPGGRAVIICPDINGLATDWAEYISKEVGHFTNWDLYIDWAEVIYGNQVGPGEYHRTPINPDFLNLLLRRAGFEENAIEVFSYPRGFKFKEHMERWDGVYVVNDNSLFRMATVVSESVKLPKPASIAAPPVPPALSIFVAEDTQVTSHGPGEK